MTKLAIALIIGALICGWYGYTRESVRSEAPVVLDRINREYFNGEINAKIRFQSLPGEYGESSTGEIVLDSNIPRSMLRPVISHEACHLFLADHGVDSHDHGKPFQDCMLRFNSYHLF